MPVVMAKAKLPVLGGSLKAAHSYGENVLPFGHSQHLCHWRTPEMTLVLKQDHIQRRKYYLSPLSIFLFLFSLLSVWFWSSTVNKDPHFHSVVFLPAALQLMDWTGSATDWIQS